MPEPFYSLAQYPLEDHYAARQHFLDTRLDWKSISNAIEKHGVIHFDISDVISIFPHLELDENYKLVCYLSKEYHGIYGHIAAIKDGDPTEHVITPEKQKLSGLFHGPLFDLPDCAAPPMEAIYNDGTHEGYYEAVLCELFLDAIPYTRFQYKHLCTVMPAPPHNLNEAWDVFVDIPDWRPRAIEGWKADTILLFRREIETGIGASDGRDHVYLTRYNFRDRLDMYHALTPKSERSTYRGEIADGQRYHDKRRCCVSVAASILVAEEKEYTVKGQENKLS